MKKLVLSMLCALVSLSALGQGTALLSNVASAGSGGLVMLDTGVPAESDVMVQFALPDGTLLGTPSAVLAGGVFRDSTAKVLEGVAPGAVDLTVVGWVSGNPGLTGQSEVFSLSAGGGNPPLPAGGIPASFSGLTVPTIPEPSTVALAILGGAALFFRRRK